MIEASNTTIIQDGFRIIIPLSSQLEAESKLKKGKIEIVNFDIRNPLYKECYFEKTSNKEDGEFQYAYRLWPTVFGYKGRSDGFVTFSNNNITKEEFINDILKWMKEETHTQYFQNVEGISIIINEK